MVWHTNFRVIPRKLRVQRNSFYRPRITRAYDETVMILRVLHAWYAVLSSSSSSTRKQPQNVLVHVQRMRLKNIRTETAATYADATTNTLPRQRRLTKKLPTRKRRSIRHHRDESPINVNITVVTIRYNIDTTFSFVSNRSTQLLLTRFRIAPSRDSNDIEYCRNVFLHDAYVHYTKYTLGARVPRINAAGSH